MVRFLIVVVVMVLVPSAVAAGQWVDSQQLKHLSSVHVELMFSFGSAARPCAPDADVIKAEAELVFRRAGIRVGEDPESAVRAFVGDPSTPRFHSFGVGLIGVLLTGRCAIAYEYGLVRVERLLDGGLGYVHSFTRRGVWTGPPWSAATDAMRSNTQEAATFLANEVLKAGRR